MRVLASQELNPMIIPPDVIKIILHKIEKDIKSHARLKLCEDSDTNIWSYYGMVKLTPIVLDDYLMLILTVPLVDIWTYIKCIIYLCCIQPCMCMHSMK